MDDLANNAWHNLEYICSVCGLPFQSYDERGWILDCRSGPLPPEVDNEDAIAELATNEDWLNDVVLLCDPDDEVGELIPSFAYKELSNCTFKRFENHPSSLHLGQSVARSSKIEEHEGEHMGGPCFYLCEPGCVRKHEVNISHEDFPTFDGRSYIPIHSACLTMAKRVIEFSSQKYLRSMRSLFLALRWRHAISRKSGGIREESNYTLGSSHWYGPQRGWWWQGGVEYEIKDGNVPWPGPTKDTEFNMLYTFLGDPMDIRNLTDTLLSNLEPCRRNIVDPETLILQTCLTNLPEDIFHIILLYLRSSRDLPQAPNYILPQRFWKDELIGARQGILPWLWDIEPDKINSKASDSCPGEDGLEWNWEALVRQLSCRVDGGIRQDVPEHIDVYAPSGRRGHYEFDEDMWTFTGYAVNLKHVPKGLHNRRRIWQLLEEMFVGDQLPVAKKKSGGNLWTMNTHELLSPTEKCVELPWTKEGGLKESAIWLPALCMDYAFARRIGGTVYAIAKKSLAQYWQSSEFRKAKGDESEDPVEPASVAEIYEVIRKIGYPV